MPRIALYMQDKHPIRYELEIARYAEERGFSEIWQADTRLARDCVVMMSAFLTQTRRLRFGSGILPIWSRNPAVIAATWSTMWELGGKVDGRGRLMLGLGAWWEPIAGRVGIERRKPLKAMREHVEALRKLFTMEEVTYLGEFVHLDRIKLDVAFGDTSPRDIPIYIGATGDQMLEMTGEIADGAVLNYCVPPEYNDKAMELLDKGARRAGRRVEDLDRPQLVVCAVDNDRKKAIEAAKVLLTQYLAQQPHIAKASGVSEDIVKKVQSVLGWPATKEQVHQAMQYVPDEFVLKISATGTPAEARAKVEEYIKRGCTCPILYPMADPYLMIDTFAQV